MKVPIGLNPFFEQALLAGKVDVSLWLRQKGKPGDTFRAFGITFVIERVTTTTYAEVIDELYPHMGFESADLFRDFIRRHYARKHFAPDLKIYVHWFKRQEPTT